MKQEIDTLSALLGQVPTHELFADNLLKFSEFFLETAKTLNLTAIKQPHEVMIKHYYDSLYLLKTDLVPQNAKIIDVGCGGGFPSMPIKIARPDCEFVLLDSLKKRLTFLDNAISLLELNKISTLHDRAEQASRNPIYRDNFDLAVSRAVAPLNLLSELCLPFVKVGGYFIAYKSKGTLEEINDAKSAISKLSAEVSDIIDYDLPENMGTRSLVVIKKLKPTHPSLPRSTKNMAKGPL